MKTAKTSKAQDKIAAAAARQLRKPYPKDMAGQLNVTVEGDAPELRIPDSKSAYSLLEYHIMDASRRSTSRQRVRGLVDGNAPYDAEKAEWGVLNTTNVNFKVAAKYLKSLMTPLQALLLSSPLIASIKLRDPNFKLVPEVMADYESTIEEEWDEILRVDARDFGPTLNKCIEEMCIEGGGPLVFTVENDMLPRGVEFGSVYVGKGASTSPTRLEFFAVKDIVTASYLYSKVRNEEAGRSAGWIPEMVWGTIANARGNNRENFWNRAEQTQKMFRRNDLLYSADTHDIIVYHLWNVEFDGSITYSLVPLSPNQKTVVPVKDGLSGFLCRKKLKATSLDEILHPMFTNVGDGSWHSVRGDVHDSYGFLDWYNKSLNELADSGKMAGSVFVKFDNQSSQNMAPLVQGAGICRIPFGVTIEQQAQPNLMQGPLQALDRIQRELSGGFAHLSKESGKGDAYKPAAVKEQENLQEAQDEITFAATLLNNFGWVMQQMYNRAQTCTDELSKKFRQRLKDRGIPDEIIQAQASVYAAGSPQLASAKTQAATSQFLMTLLGRSQVDDDVIIQDALVTHVGKRRAQRITVSKDNRGVPDADMWQATLENGAFIDNKPTVVYVQQDHIIHLKTHLQFFTDQLNALQQIGTATNGDPNNQNYMQQVNKTANVLGAGIPHCSYHGQYGSQVPSTKEQVEQYVSRINSLQNSLKKLQKILADAAKAQQAVDQQTAANGKVSPKDKMDLQLKQVQLQEAQAKLSEVQTRAQMEIQREAANQARMEKEGQLRLNEIRMKALANISAGQQPTQPLIAPGE